jgi:phosphatidate cytidylyltransferase
MSVAGKWGDLAPRVISGVVMAGVGFGLLYIGGLLLAAGLIALGGVGMWELHRMLGGTVAKRAGAIAALAVFAVLAAQIFALASGYGFLDNLHLTPWIFPFLGVGIWAGVQSIELRHRWVYCTYGALFLFAVIGIFYLRVVHGLIFVLFVVGVVVASDIAGYFAGRFLGGPKFWPRVSPKKTWSGTVAGWIAASTVAVAVLGFEPLFVFVVAPVLALAAQLGDIAQSAIKRRVGVKDSSDLIPGHGGVLDRFDAMAGAGAAATLAMAVFGLWQ